MRSPVDGLDRLFGLAAGRVRFFSDGWGDRGALAALGPEAIAATPPADVAIAWRAERRSGGVVERRGTFESPAPELPDASRTAHLALLLPEGPVRGGVAVLAASGDQGFEARRRFAAPLVREGLAALLLENPYYGRRRPDGQRGAGVRTVLDLARMAHAAVQEGRALVAWLAREFGPAGVTGYSMGGQMAALVAASFPRPVAAAPLAPSSTPAAVFTQGLLRRVVDAGALAGGGPDALPALRELLLRFDVCAVPPPAAPHAAVVVGAARDGIVPPAEPERIARHWGSELRWLDTGHVGAVLWHGEALRRAVRDAFARLAAGGAP